MCVCGQTCRGIGANMIKEINFVGFWFGCWVFSSLQLILKSSLDREVFSASHLHRVS